MIWMGAEGVMGVMRHGRYLVPALLALLLPGACAGQRPAAPPAARSAAAPDYVIGPGDALNVVVYRAPELGASGLPVRPDGRISLPLVPDLQAAGQTPTQLGKQIEERLRKYVREPNVSVLVQTFLGPSSERIRVIGEAASPMAMPYREGMTVLDVMIEARGLTRFAAGNSAEIIRRNPGTGPDGASGRAGRTAIPVRLSDLLRDGDLSQDVPMQPGDVLVIPQSWF